MLEICSLLLALSLGQTSATADATGRIAGRVTVEGTNAPVSGAHVMLLPAAPRIGPMTPRTGPMMPPQAITDRDGRYAFERLAPGTYRIQAEKTGFALQFDPTQSRTVTIAAGQSADGVEVQLQKGAVISGKVLDPAGEPMPDARIMALRKITPPGAPPRLLPAPGQGQQTNDLGEYRIAGLPPGEYYVAATARSMSMFGGPASNPTTSTPARTPGQAHTTIASTFYPGTSDQAAAQPVAVVAGAEVGNITFTMQTVPSFRVSGVVVDEEGKPVAGAMVMLMGDRSGMLMGPIGSARTQDGGRFDVDDVPPGGYRASASIPMMVGSAGGGATGGIGGSVAWSSVALSGGYVSATFGSGGGGAIDPPAEIVVADADVKDVRVTVRRPVPR